MKNWVNIWSIKSIINNIANPDGDLKTFQFGKDKDKDTLFLQQIKRQLPPRMVQRLGILRITDTVLLKEIQFLNQGIIDGSPIFEIIEQCDDSECVDIIDKPAKDCPPQETIEQISDEYVEICSTDNLVCPAQPPPRETPCTVNDCISFAKNYCSNLITPNQKTK
jgi:hypothetical protein